MKDMLHRGMGLSREAVIYGAICSATDSVVSFSLGPDFTVYEKEGHFGFIYVMAKRVIYHRIDRRRGVER